MQTTNRAVRPVTLLATLAAALVLACCLAILFGETPLTGTQIGLALSQPTSAPAEIVWGIRAPRVLAAALVGGALGLAGALMQGLLRNPLADPGVLGVSSCAALGPALVIAVGATAPGTIETAALAGAAGAGVLLVFLANRLREPTTLILFGVALSALGGALTSLVFNLAASPITANEVLNWLLGSVANRSWNDLAGLALALGAGSVLAAVSAPALRMLTLGEEAAAVSGLPMSTLRMAAVAATAILAGSAVAVSGVIGFVGLVAPHMVRGRVAEDPALTLAPSALAGAILLVLADLAARLIPTDEELKLGVVTALIGAPLFGLIAWRAAASWRQ